MSTTFAEVCGDPARDSGVAILSALTAMPLAAAGNAASYRATVVLYPGDDPAAVAKRLAATYRGRLETPVDERGTFTITLSPNGADLLARDPQVAAMEPASAAAAIPHDAVAQDHNVGATWPLGDYKYDGSGNIRKIGADFFVYDTMGRLRRGDAAGLTQSYTYDGFGNIRTITTSGSSHLSILGVDASTNQADKSGIESTTGQVANMVAVYDTSGRMTSYLQDEFQYDALDVVKKSNVGGKWRSYIYTASDERIATVELTSASGTEVRSDWTIRDTSGKVLRRFSRENGAWQWNEDYIYRGDRMLASEIPGPIGRYQYHLDHLGTPRLITGNGGVEISRHTYYPFGREATTGTTDGERKQFTGHERDAANLDYMHARYYQPIMGRFLSVDPANFWQVRPGDKAAEAKLQGQLRKPQGWNRYAYVSNNPINAVDPDGRETFVITTFDYGIGSHSAVLVARNGDNVLYDPAGSYVPESLKAEGGQRGSGDMFYGKDADLKSYVAYQKSTGSEVKVLKFNTTPQQEAQIKNRIEQRPGSTAPGNCTPAVCSVISGVGPFKDVKSTRWPGRLYERLKDLLTR